MKTFSIQRYNSADAPYVSPGLHKIADHLHLLDYHKPLKALTIVPNSQNAAVHNTGYITKYFTHFCHTPLTNVPLKGVNAMQHSNAQAQTLNDDVMEVWAQRARQQLAALDAIKDFLR